MNITIRPAQLDDVGSLTDLLRSLGWFEAVTDVPFEEAIGRVGDHLSQCLADDSHSVYVGVDNEGEVQGYVSVHWLPYLLFRGPEGYVSELFLRETARGQGLGAALLETVKGEATRRGCFRLSLLNNRSRESYQRGFYSKHGWEERQIMAHFVYWMEKENK
jgi:GNAT superfamily N-acetyltransferase